MCGLARRPTPQVGIGTTDSMGNFTMSVGDYTGPLMLQTSGGTYTDEATGSMMSMMSGDVMYVCVPSFAAGSALNGVQITPLHRWRAPRRGA